MENKYRSNNVIVDLWQWYEHRYECTHGPLAKHALDKCVESFEHGEWRNFGYWHAIYVRERSKAPNRRFEGNQS